MRIRSAIPAPGGLSAAPAATAGPVGPGPDPLVLIGALQRTRGTGALRHPRAAETIGEGRAPASGRKARRTRDTAERSADLPGNRAVATGCGERAAVAEETLRPANRKSTLLNSSHVKISY